MKTNKIKLLVALAVAMSSYGKAETLSYSDSVNQIVYANGNTLPFATAEDFTQISVKLGWFNDAFTPTENNFASWETNFNALTTLDGGVTSRGALGYAISSAAGTALAVPQIAAQIVFGRNSAGGDFASTYPSGKTLYLIGSSLLNSTTGASGSLYSSTAQFFAATGRDSTWLIPTVSADGGSANYALSVIDAQSDMVVGSWASNQITMIPEPSSASLLALGVAGLVALRARRKS